MVENLKKVSMKVKSSVIGGLAITASVLGLGVANAQTVPQITSSTATTVATPMVNALIEGLVWFWTNLGATFMWLALIGAVVYAIYRRIHYGKVF